MRKIAAAVALALLSSSAMALQVVGTGTGAIPDGTSGTCGNWGPLVTDPPPAGTGAPLVINFAVAGLAVNVTSVGIRVTGTHAWVGDMVAILAGPGGTQRQFIMADTGAAAGAGSASDFGGPYNFEDIFTGNFTTAAAATPVPAGNYRAFRSGPHTPVTLNTVFGGLTPAQANGTWTLSVYDTCLADTGTITATTLFINEPSPVSLQSFNVD